MSMSADRLGYARVSTQQQDGALQLHALRAASCDRLFADKASRKFEHRPALKDLPDQGCRGVNPVVWRLDRCGRTLRNRSDVVAALEQRGVGFISLTESLDTTAPGGRLLFHLMAGWPSSRRTSSASAPWRPWPLPGPGVGPAGVPPSRPTTNSGPHAMGAPEVPATSPASTCPIPPGVGLHHPRRTAPNPARPWSG